MEVVVKFHKRSGTWVIFKATAADDSAEYHRLQEYSNDPDQTAVTGDRQVMWLKLKESQLEQLVKDDSYQVSFAMLDGEAWLLEISPAWDMLED